MKTAPSVTYFETRAAEAPIELTSLYRPGGYAWIRRHEGLVAGGELVRFDPGTGPNRFARAAEFLDELFERATVDNPVDGIPGTGPVAFGSFTFDEESPGSSVVVPEWVAGRLGEKSWVTVTKPSGRPPSPIQHALMEPDSSIEVDQGNLEGWLGSARRAIGLVESGELRKLVLARSVEVSGNSAFDLRRILGRLSDRYPDCYTFGFESLIGSTPELLVRSKGSHVYSVPLAGSAPRGEDPAEDDLIAQALLTSQKDLLEHALAVESVVTRLRPVCNLLKSEREPTILKLEGVQHLSTQVHGQLNTPLSSLELAGLLHPTAAVAGLPLDQAVSAIRDLETFPRGRYAGPVGWVDDHGDGDWGIALRCAEVTGSSASLFAGSGIVRGSDADEELGETVIKLRAMLEALA